MRISELEKNGHECLNLLPQYTLNKKTYPCPNPDCGSSDAFNVTIKDGSLLGYCFSCQTGYNFRSLYKEINNLNHDEYIENLLTLGYQTDFTALIDPVEIFKTMKKKHVKDNELIKIVSEERKIDPKTIEKYCIVNDDLYLKTLSDDQLGYIIGGLGGPTLEDKTLQEKVKVLTMNDFLLIPKVSYDGVYGGFITCYPKSEKNFRYRNWYNSNTSFLFEDTLNKKCEKIYITEGIFSALTVLNNNIPVLSITGGSNLDFPQRLLEILDNFKNIKSIVFAFDTDIPGIKKTKSFLDIIYNDLLKRNIKVEIFQTKFDDKFDSFDDMVNNKIPFEKIDWLSFTIINAYKEKTKVINSLLTFKRSLVLRNEVAIKENLKKFLNVGDDFINKTFDEFRYSTSRLSFQDKNEIYNILERASETDINSIEEVVHLINNLKSIISNK